MFKHKVKDYFDLSATPGDVGIEIEMESRNPVPYDGTYTDKWRVEEDHSLRGYSAELVLKRPVPFEEVPKLMAKLKKQLKAAEVDIKPTIRAGVHLHINMQRHTMGEMFKFMMCYYALETVLTNFCGNGRQGNLFCLRGQDAEYSRYMLGSAIQRGRFTGLQTNSLRYSALNFQSLFSYGSLEFRALATTKDLNNIEVWADILHKVKDYAISSGSCWDNISEISGMGPSHWLTSIVGEEYAKVLEYPDMERDIMKDVRGIQSLCYELSSKGV